MTADAPQDFPYEPVMEAASPSVRQAYWSAAIGLQRVDGLVPSAYLYEVVDSYVKGECSLAKTGELLRAHEHANEREREADLVSQRIVELLSSRAFALLPRCARARELP